MKLSTTWDNMRSFEQIEQAIDITEFQEVGGKDIALVVEHIDKAHEFMRIYWPH